MANLWPKYQQSLHRYHTTITVMIETWVLWEVDSERSACRNFTVDTFRTNSCGKGGK